MLPITKNCKRDNCVWLLADRERQRERERKRKRQRQRQRQRDRERKRERQTERDKKWIKSWRKYAKRGKMLNTTLFTLIQQQKLFANTLETCTNST